MTRISHAIAEVVNLTPSTHQPYVGVSAFAHKAGLHASAIKVDPDLYQHIDPEQVGNTMRMLVSDMAGRASIELKGKELGVDLGGDRELIGRVVERVKERELAGYTYEAADASFELLLRERGRGQARAATSASSPGGPSSRTAPTARHANEATVKLWAKGERIVATAEGNGPVNALDRALRVGLERIYPQLAKHGARRLQGPHPGGQARHRVHDPGPDLHRRRHGRVVHGRRRRERHRRLLAGTGGRLHVRPAAGRVSNRPSSRPRGRPRPPLLKRRAGFRGGGGVSPEDPAAPYRSCHFWLAAPVQVQICSRVPFGRELSVTSRHLFAAGLTRSPVGTL